MEIKLKVLFISAFFLCGSLLSAQTNSYTATTGLSRGESLFKENNAKDAVQLLEYEIQNGQISDNSYNFLGLGYYQLGEYEKSLDAFKRGLKAQPENKKLLSYNMGNTYYALKNYNSAIDSYSEALKADPLFYDALLNRANAILMAGQLKSAREEYINFIDKAPDNPQRERIELLIQALEEEIARREEEARLLAEQNKAKWEEYDGKLNDNKSESFSPDWEEVEGELSERKDKSAGPEWERIAGTEAPAMTDDRNKEKVLDSVDTEDSGEYWEEFGDNENTHIKTLEEELVDDQWLAFSEEEIEEIRELDELSQQEHEKWLEEERRKAQEIASRQAKEKQDAQQQALVEERRMREELLEEMRKAEEERRKKLLEDVANSLQDSDTTNLTSGAEDLIDYDLEGELD